MIGAVAAGAAPGEVSFEDHGQGRFAVFGELSFATAVDALEQGRTLFSDHSVLELDLAGIKRADSAGLAVLLEWVTWARNTAREISYRNLPQQVLCIAQISEVEDMLHRAERWTGA